MSFGDAFDQFQQNLREHLEPSLQDLEIRDRQDVGWDIMGGAQNIQKVGRMSDSNAGTAGYEAKWNVKLQRGGLMEGAGWGDTQLVKMGPDASLMMGALATSLHGDPTKAPLPSQIQLKSLLKKSRGMYTLTHDAIESRLLSEPIADVTTDCIEDITSLVREKYTSFWWGSGNGVMGLAPSGGITIPEASLVWTTIDAGQVFRFIRGQRYVAASMSSGNPATPRAGSLTTPGVFRCVGVDHTLRKVAFQSEPGQGTITVTAADGIIYNGMWNFTAGSTLCSNGIHNLLLSSGAFPDSAITDVTDYPELKALIEGDDTSTATYEEPTPEMLDGLLDLLNAFDAETPPVLVAEHNVWTLYNHLERRANMMVVVPQGSPYTASGAVNGPVYQNGDRRFQIARSGKIKPNIIAGLDPSSFMKFLPNDLQVRWRIMGGGVTGVPQIFRTVQNGPQLTDIYAAEFDTYAQITCKAPNRNIIRKGVHSKRTYDSVA